MHILYIYMYYSIYRYIHIYIYMYIYKQDEYNIWHGAGLCDCIGVLNYYVCASVFCRCVFVVVVVLVCVCVQLN